MAFPSRIRWCALTAWLTILTAGSGCALWSTDDVGRTTARSPLKHVTPNVDAIELEVSFVERPIGDPLLGSRMWSELVTVSTLDPSTATALRRNGFRFGVAGSEPPQNLAAAMGVTGGKYNYHRYSQRSGEEMTIEAWPAYATCDIDIDAAGQSRKKSYEQARCMFRVTPERLQDGWVKLSFIPEIHHGDLKIRPIPGNQGWEQMPSQLIEPLFDQRFSVELNLGEMIVLSADGDNAQSVGHHFFRGGTSENKLQRVLMVRAVGMKRLNLLRE